MSGINFVFNKIKFFIVGILDVIRYLCCSSRSRKKSVSDFAPLTSIGIVGKDSSLIINNEDINFVEASSGHFCQTRNVQDYITQYRQQKCKELTSESNDNVTTDFFQDMEPKIVRQQKLVLKAKEEPAGVSGVSRNSRLACSTDMKASELSAWEEMGSTGNWDIDEKSTSELLKEKRRIERERKLLENMQKRMDKDRHRIASKISFRFMKTYLCYCILLLSLTAILYRSTKTKRRQRN